MKVVVIGGTGLIGSKVVTKLLAQGHEAVAASPNSGVNAVTGEGLAEVLKGAAVTVDVSNSPDWEDSAVLKFSKHQPVTCSPTKLRPALCIMWRCPLSGPTSFRKAATSAQRSPRKN